MDKYNKHTRYYVYSILSLRDFTFYTGFATDLTSRLSEHAKGIVSACPIRIPFLLVHYEYFITNEDAKRRELYLTSGKGRAELKNTLQITLRNKRSIPYRMVR